MIACRRVIFNADDFGLTDGVCRGIREAASAGIVTATTAMVCTEGARDRVVQWGPSLAGRIGIHLQLTQGRACLDQARVPSIVDSASAFPESPADIVDVNLGHVRDEWSAQIETLRSWGVEPSHMDSHHNIGLKPHIVEAYVATAVSNGLPARTNSPALTATLRARGARCVDLSVTSWYDGKLSAKKLLRVVEGAFDRVSGQGTIEVMCHPGFADERLAAKSNYVRQREVELGVLTSDKLLNGLRKLDVEVGSMTTLAA